jgi:hypothetical protein
MSSGPGQQIQEVLDLIDRCGGIDGDHHKQWVLDQVVRILTGDGYGAWVASREKEGYEWEEGIPP